MTEDAFRERFVLDQRAGRPTYVADEACQGAAVALYGPVIRLRGGDEIALADARFLGPFDDDWSGR